MSQTSLSALIAGGRHEFTEETINIPASGEFVTHTDFKSFDAENLFLNFEKCTFKGGYLEFDSIIEQHVSVRFFDCIFDCELVIRDCSFFTLGFRDTIKIKSIEISHGKFEHLYFRNNEKKDISGNISITNNIIINTLEFDNLHHTKGAFKFSIENDYTIEEHKKLVSTFKNSTFSVIEFNKSFFGEEVNFQKLNIKKSISFDDCKFNKTHFEYSKFNSEVKFHDCKFYSYFGFEECEYIEFANISFSSCLFKSFVHFNESKFNHLDIQYTTFERKTSFDRLETNTLTLYQVTFMQSTYFDELKIHKIEDKEYIKSLKPNEARDLRLTIRSIKHELQKSENRIDYGRFRGYELEAYYQELNGVKIRKFDKDRLILWTTKHVTGFDHSWKKALCFILSSAFVFFSIFFILENYALPFSSSGIPQYITGYLRFLLITDFYNPLIQSGREYISNDGVNHIFSWFIFILGKIFVAFGIYEMIQAFRKFKA